LLKTKLHERDADLSIRRAPSGYISHCTYLTPNVFNFPDRLLCHDDKCEDRHVAFVIYLTEGWTEKDGGNLELLSTDDNGDPNKIVVSIPATYNTLALFEVSDTSYHMVIRHF